MTNIIELNHIIEQIKTYDIFLLPKQEVFLALTIQQLESIIKKANNAYYHTNSPMISDHLYDMFRDRLEELDPAHTLLKTVGSGNHGKQKDKVKLPYWMGSMDKIKPNSKKKLEQWFSIHQSTEYVFSDKLDGISCLYYLSYNNETYIEKLFTRGNGTYGQDISHLLHYCKMPSIDIKTLFIEKQTFCCRGEIIVSKKIFNEKYKKTCSNARNLVSGLVNSKKINVELAKDVDIIMYELIEPCALPIGSQFVLLRDIGFFVVPHKIIQHTPCESDIQNYLVKRKDISDYEIDGIIITHNDLYYRNISGNPQYSFAYKMIFGEQIKKTKIIAIEWRPSKDGYLKPRIQVEPIIIGGTKIMYTTGFNAKYIKENVLGPGAIVEMIRSGDVIPTITKIISPTKLLVEDIFPKENYVWNETGVDIIVTNSMNNRIVTIKTITRFMKKIGVKHISEATIKKMIEKGFDTIDKIIVMTMDDLVTLEACKKKMASNIYHNIHKIVDKPISLEVLMEASNIFGRGFGLKRCKRIINCYPNILYDNTINETSICEIDGFSHKTAKQFIDRLELFRTFINNNHFIISKGGDTGKDNSENKKYNNQHFVFTGIRDKSLEKYIIDNGGMISTIVNSKTTAVIRKSVDTNTHKIQNAKKLKIPIYSIKEFTSMIFEKKM
tara:strand:- start:73 stop:2070 length:1998 start_codon:yes stop_codon:yes gene_type:complete